MYFKCWENNRECKIVVRNRRYVFLLHITVIHCAEITVNNGCTGIIMYGVCLRVSNAENSRAVIVHALHPQTTVVRSPYSLRKMLSIFAQLQRYMKMNFCTLQSIQHFTGSTNPSKICVCEFQQQFAFGLSPQTSGKWQPTEFTHFRCCKNK